MDRIVLRRYLSALKFLPDSALKGSLVALSYGLVKELDIRDFIAEYDAEVSDGFELKDGYKQLDVFVCYLQALFDAFEQSCDENIGVLVAYWGVAKLLYEIADGDNKPEGYFQELLRVQRDFVARHNA